MDFGAVGNKIKELRKNLRISQGELAEGICTQAQISKIEKGVVYPYATTLYLISQKLGVDVNYFFDIGMTPRLDYVQEVSDQLKSFRRNHQYHEMKELVLVEEDNPLFEQNNKNMQLLLWHKGIYQYELNGELDTAIATLEAAVALTHNSEKVWTEKEIEILLTIGAMYVRADLEKALEVFEKVRDNIKLIPHLTDLTIKTRLYYNLARVLTRLEKIEDSISCCQEAIQWCLKNDMLYLLGQLHYQIGYNYEQQGKTDEAVDYLKRALTIFELQNDTKFIPLITKRIAVHI